MTKQEWIAEFAKEFHAQTQIKYSSCFEVAESVFETYAEDFDMSPDEAVQEELSQWGE